MRDNARIVQRPDSADLLAWYDRNARELPWRIPPAASRAGVLPDPYRVWLSEVMLQQTSVASVIGYFDDFTSRWPGIKELAAADDSEVMAAWAGLGYYARARNLLRCARMVSDEFGGVFPDQAEALQKLPGIGPYTAAAIAAIAFGRAETVVDGNVERVMARLFALSEPLPGVKPKLRQAAATLTPAKRAGDHAQAVMDLGATICTLGSPRCGACPWCGACRSEAMGIAGELPRRLPKTKKPVRKGVVFVVRRTDGALLLERRPAHGLLGGMLGWPGYGWDGTDRAPEPIAGDWRLLPVEVRHSFTHFHLRLEIRFLEVTADCRPQSGRFVPPGDFCAADLPTLMRKVHDVLPERQLAGAGNG